MRAVVLHGERSVSVENVPDPGLSRSDSAIVMVERTAICGSDLHLYHNPAFAGLGVRLGHEFVGTVADIGPDVRRLRPGDRVLVSGVVGCGHCLSCLARDPGLCRNNGLSIFGVSPDLPGGQAEAVDVPAADIFALEIPETLNTDQAVLLTDILPTGYLGALRADIHPGATVAVIGLGPVGMMALQCAQLFGPARTLAVDMVPERLARAEKLGAETVDATGGNAVAAVMELTGGRGAESVIEAVGSDQTVADALSCAAPGGTVSVVGVNLTPALPFPMMQALMNRLTFRVTLASIPRTWDALIPLIAAGRLHPEEVFTHRMPLSAAPDAYRIFDTHADGVLKVLLDPAG
jgi:2-desacetyl-2-hydroxyethyl bacteriochlorophyllide A dehydrogenase